MAWSHSSLALPVSSSIIFPSPLPRLYAPFEYVPFPRPILHRQPLAPDLQQHNIGCKVVTSAPLKGTLSDKRSAHLQYIFSVPQCLQFTRGSTIPVSLSIISTDVNILATSPASSSLVVRLDRYISLDPTVYLDALTLYNSWESSPEEMCRAKWLEPVIEEMNNGQPKLTFHGELHVPKDIPPNCEIMNLRLEYTISVYPSKFSGFSPATSLSKAVLSERIEIIAPRPACVLDSLNTAPPEYST